jgi:hypothetical protein
LAAQADMLRIATYNPDLSAHGPGLLLHDLRKEDLPPQRAAVVAVIAALDADVLVLTGVDYDLRGEALDALERRLAAAGSRYPYRLALRPNTGVPTGRDLDRNGRRNHDEAAFWLRLLEGGLPMPPPEGPFVILGQTSLDPMDGDGRPEALRALLAHPALQDPRPRGDHGRVDPGQAGDAALDTALYDGLGGLRVSVILPSADLMVRAAAVLWPPDSDPMAATLTAASRHSPIWVDLALP